VQFEQDGNQQADDGKEKAEHPPHVFAARIHKPYFKVGHLRFKVGFGGNEVAFGGKLRKVFFPDVMYMLLRFLYRINDNGRLFFRNTFGSQSLDDFISIEGDCGHEIILQESTWVVKDWKNEVFSWHKAGLEIADKHLAGIGVEVDGHNGNVERPCGEKKGQRIFRFPKEAVCG